VLIAIVSFIVYRIN